MKVNITKETKKAIYAYQIDAAKAVCDSLKEDDFKPSDYALMAANFIASFCDDFCVMRIIEADAHIMPNCNCEYNAFCDDSENLDVWIDFIADGGSYGFMRGGAYLSDIWQIGPDENRVTLRRRMYARIAKYTD